MEQPNLQEEAAMWRGYSLRDLENIRGTYPHDNKITPILEDKFPLLGERQIWLDWRINDIKVRRIIGAPFRAI